MRSNFFVGEVRTGQPDKFHLPFCEMYWFWASLQNLYPALCCVEATGVVITIIVDTGKRPLHLYCAHLRLWHLRAAARFAHPEHGLVGPDYRKSHEAHSRV